MSHFERKTYDCIVIGMGGMGSASIYQIAKRGSSVLGLEQFDIPNSRGSSHGVNRIIRLAYYEDPSYVPLLIRAYELWTEIEQKIGNKLLFKTGSIDAGPEDSEVFKSSLRSCEIHDIDHEVLSANELNMRFNGYQLPDGHFGLLQRDGGFLLSEKSISAFVDVAKSYGAEIHKHEPVLEWETRNGEVQVTTEYGTYSSKTLIISVGAWISKMVPSFSKITSVERQVLGWFKPSKPDIFAPENFPVFNLLVDEGRYYGFPIYGIPGFKIGKYHHLGEEIAPEQLENKITLRDEQVLLDAVKKYFPHALGPALALKTCMFTNTPDEHFILDTLPGHPNIMIVAGFSGHGFKFCSVVGEIAADIVLKGQTNHNIDLLSLSRFKF